MSFWEKIKNGLRRFMEGRSGPDELCFAILIFALVLMLVSSFFASWRSISSRWRRMSG